MDKKSAQERLTPEEERRIDNRIRIIIVVCAAALAAYLIFTVATKRELGLWYQIAVVAFLAANWLLSDVLSIYFKHGLAGRTQAQRQACMRTILFGLVANIGLGWFLLTLNSNSLFGALIYVFAIQAQRKEREKYGQEPDEEESGAEQEALLEEDMPLPTAADREARAPMTAAERMERLGLHAEQDEAEDTDGSV